MSYHENVKGKQFVKKLRKRGVEIIEGRGKGGHVLAKYQGRISTIKTHGDKDLSRTYMKVVCKQLGIELSDL